MSIIQGTSKSSAAGGYSIDQSIRFNFSDAAHLLRTPSTASNRRTWTWSLWVKRSGLGNPGGPNQVHQLFGVGAGSCLRFTSSDQLRLETPAGNHTFVTSQVFRDTSAWYHIVLAFDSTQATDTDRRKLYVNGSQVTDFSSTTFTGLAQNAEWDINSTSQHQIAKSNLADYFGGYLAEINFVDGQALAPTDFGETNDDGVWVPIAYTGSYGTNGFYITGADSADLGADDSGNSNDFTSSGLTSADQMLGTPTDNFCTLNPLYKNSAVVLSDGNLTATSASGNVVSMSTFAVNSGKWYWEMTFTGTMTGAVYGIGKHPVTLNNYLGIDQYGWSVLGGYSGAKLTNNSGGGFGETYKGSNVLSGETVACALDMDTGKVYWGSDGTTDGTGTFAWYASGDPVAGTNFAFSGLTGDIYPACDADSRGTMVVNFGQSPFRYSADIPTGFVALSTANLPDPTIADPSAHVGTLLWSGDGTSPRNISGLSFQPGLSWIKNRTGGFNHNLSDQVRGGGKTLFPSSTSAEQTNYSEGYISAFNSDGIQTTNGTSSGHVNDPSYNYVAWNWKANGSGSSNTDGSITSTVSADTTSGFSIVKYAGNLSTTGSATVGHGLGTAPLVVISKSLDSTAGDSGGWSVQHTSLAASNILRLNTTDAASSKAANGTLLSPTSTVFYTNYTEGLNVTGNDYIAYCFAEVEGFSKIGSYSGNGSTDGPFIYTGFKPAFVMTKRTNAAGDWKMWDNERGPYNVNGLTLAANSFGTESSGVAQHNDFLSNGFKIRGNDTETNGSGSTYIYMAFAESPFKTATAR